MSRHRTRPDLCGAHGHPAVTFNPWLNRSWCLCGRVVEAGNAVTWPKADGIDGVLREVLSPPPP